MTSGKILQHRRDSNATKYRLLPHFFQVRLKILQKTDQFAVEFAVQRVGMGVFDVAGALPADVDADNFVAFGEVSDKAFKHGGTERALVPVRGRIGGRERILIDGEVEVRREVGFAFPGACPRLTGMTGDLLPRDFAFFHKYYFIQNASIFRLRKFRTDFVHKVVGDSDEDDPFHKPVILQYFQHPAAAAQDASESRGLHIGMVVEDNERERFLDHVRPNLAHVVVVSAIDEVDSLGILDARFGDLPADSVNRIVVAVAVRPLNAGTVKPCCSGL